MFQEPTVFIVGAGASCEVGFPAGPALADEIVRLTAVRGKNEKPQLFEAVRHGLPRAKIYDLIDVCAAISKGLRFESSIDIFLNSHRNDALLVTMGKLAIAESIRKFETQSYLFSHSPTEFSNFEEVKDSWYLPFFQRLVREIDADQVDISSLFSNVTIATFNYDRSLERFLKSAMRQRFRWDSDRASEALASLKIYHMYGSLGDLDDMTPYGVIGNYQVAADRIKTFTEKLDEGDELQDVRKKIATARNIIFLGFAFHEQNVQLLCPDPQISPRTYQAFYSTTYQVPDPVRDDWFSRVQNWYRPHPAEGPKNLEFHYVPGGSCRNLFDNFHTRW